MDGRKDSVDLICDIGELAGLFEKSSSLDGFLDSVVQTVAYHMRAAVCSIYLFDGDTQELVLTANQGLNPEEVGKVRLRLGEGITGTALKQLRTIRVGVATKSPFFKAIPNLDEEPYMAFMAVPILRGITRIGVLVVEDPSKDYFSETDGKALQAIAAQLASVIEHANLLISLHDAEAGDGSADVGAPVDFVKGKPGSSGWACGPAVLVGESGSHFGVPPAAQALPRHLDDFIRAVARTGEQIEGLQKQMDELLEDVASLIFSAHLLMLRDPSFTGAMEEMIRDGLAPQEAISRVVNEYVDLFAASKSTALREKTQDVRDLGRRLMQNLLDWEEDHADYSGHIVVANSLMPSDVLKLAAQRAAGLVHVGGGRTSHVAILARSLDIPMVLTDERRLLQLAEGTELLIDADHGAIHVNPSAGVREEYERVQKQFEESRSEASASLAETGTADGCRLKLYATVNLLRDLRTAAQFEPDGIGLYRTEFPFMIRNNFPSEEEQYRIYRTAMQVLPDKPTTFRTLDVGADKPLPYFPGDDEANPFLGLRGIRFSLRHDDIFTTQLRALLRAGLDAPLRIMFPLVCSVDEVLACKEAVAACSKALEAEGVAHNPTPQLGIMIETPAAAAIADQLAVEVDFFCVGSNDLIGYLLAVDRTNADVNHMFLAHHPAVLRSLQSIAASANQRGINLSICGDITGNKDMIAFLLGVGYREFSVDARGIPQAQAHARTVTLDEAETFAQSLLSLQTVDSVEAALRDRAARSLA